MTDNGESVKAMLLFFLFFVSLAVAIGSVSYIALLFSEQNKGSKAKHAMGRQEKL